MDAFHRDTEQAPAERRVQASELVSRIQGMNDKIIIEKVYDTKYKVYCQPSRISISTKHNNQVHYPVPVHVILSTEHGRLDVRFRYSGMVALTSLFVAIAILVLGMLLNGLLRSGTSPSIRVVLVQIVVLFFGVGIPGYFAWTIVSGAIAATRVLRRVIETAICCPK